MLGMCTSGCAVAGASSDAGSVSESESESNEDASSSSLALSSSESVRGPRSISSSLISSSGSWRRRRDSLDALVVGTAPRLDAAAKPWRRVAEVGMAV